MKDKEGAGVVIKKIMQRWAALEKLSLNSGGPNYSMLSFLEQINVSQLIKNVFPSCQLLEDVNLWVKRWICTGRMGGKSREQLLGLLLAGMLAIPNLEQLQAELYLSKL